MKYQKNCKKTLEDIHKQWNDEEEVLEAFRDVLDKKKIYLRKQWTVGITLIKFFRRKRKPKKTIEEVLECITEDTLSEEDREG